MTFEEIRNPRWEIGDPFRSGQLRKARFEFLQVKAQRDMLARKVNEILGAKDRAVEFLTAALAEERSRVNICEGMLQEFGEEQEDLKKQIEGLKARCEKAKAERDEALRECSRLTDEIRKLQKEK